MRVYDVREKKGLKEEKRKFCVMKKKEVNNKELIHSVWLWEQKAKE